MKNCRTRNLIALPAIVMVLSLIVACSGSGEKTDATSEYQGVKIGVITYSWRSMPGSPADIIKYCKQTGINSLELMGNIAEEYAGAPSRPERPEDMRALSDEEKAAYRTRLEAYGKRMSEWRINEASPNKYQELKDMFDEAGIEEKDGIFIPLNSLRQAGVMRRLIMLSNPPKSWVLKV